jgi:hypothetical protein
LDDLSITYKSAESMSEFDDKVQERWRAISESLDATRHLLLDFGGALQAIQSLGVRSSDFPPPTLKDIMRSRAKLQKVLFESSPPPTSEQASVKMWLEIFTESKPELWRWHSELNKSVAEMPEQLATLLSGVRGVPWRAHFRRHYVDQLTELPYRTLELNMAFLSEEAIPSGYHKVSVIAPLPGLLAHIEVYEPYAFWKRLARRAKSYAADPRSIRNEIGGTLPDGPVPPNRWRSDGIVGPNAMKPLSWKLTKFLWDRKDRMETIEECADAVFGEDSRTVDKTRIGSHRKSANTFFRENRIGWEVQTKANYVFMIESQAPPP